ncbi:MAG TPA: hypothetical protein VEH30_15910 [Terriglobales bacterium]|nr:hypothetical protein [Terriglobales bacterium]
MKSLRTAVLVVLAATCAFAQSDAQKSFDQLKTLVGTWEGQTPDGKTVQVIFRETSGGSALLSEIMGHEDLITMFHMDGGRLMMTHYCGAGNQPRMVGTMSPDGKTFTFNFLDVTNVLPSQPGHMEHLTVAMLDSSHHVEEWSFQTQDGKQMRERFDLHRTK